MAVDVLPLSGWLVERHGYHTAMLVLGALSLSGAVPCVSAVSLSFMGDGEDGEGVLDLVNGLCR